MLAQSAPDVDGAWASLGPGPVVVDSKLDGIRIQVHRQGDDVRVFTRSLDDITARVPEIVAAVRAMPASDLVLDGEALAVGPDGRPRPFQETAARSATKDAEVAAVTTLTPFFFDALHVDGVDLLDAPLLRRLDALDAVAGPSVVHRLVTADVDEARDYFADVVARRSGGRRHQGGRRALRGRSPRRRVDQGQAAATPSTSWCWRSSAAPGGGRGRCRTSTSGRATATGS